MFLKSRILLGAVALLATCMAQAAVITIDVVSGNWTNVVPQSGSAALTFVDNDGLVGNEEVRWGSAGTPVNSKSGYRFDTNAPPALSVNINEQFVLGDFTHFNFPISAGTSITSARLDLLMDLTVDGTSLSEGPFLFSFLHDETTNGCNPQPTCANDLVTISNLVSSDVFSVGGIEYTIAVLGFSTNNGSVITDGFSTLEGKTNTAELYATIRTAQVAEPATLSLLGLGLLGMGLLRRSRQR